MRDFRIVQVSDTHLSRTHGYFYDNWRVFVDAMMAGTTINLPPRPLAGGWAGFAAEN